MSETVPVILDGAKRATDYGILPGVKDKEKSRDESLIGRFNYFSVECETPAPGFTLLFDEYRMPFYMVGLSGIVLKPWGKDSFEDPRDIDEFFDAMEENESVFVDVQQLWLPLFTLDRPPEPKDIYRISLEFFDIAYRFSVGDIDLAGLYRLSRDYREKGVYSEAETNSFRQWTEQHIAVLKETYPKDPELQLRRI
jgi:hypothetical protein